MTPSLAEFVRTAGKLPSLPAVYQELSRAVDNPDSSLSQIGEIIRKDQSLASRLLRLANSALYSFPSQIETVEAALQMIGLRETQNLALATCVIRAFSGLPADLIDPAAFWEHSIACGIASALLAEERHDPTPERLLVGGLLHDVGRLVLLIKAPELSRDILQRCEAEEAPVVPIETEVLGFDHAMLGGELLRMWRLPPSLQDMVRWHHLPAGATVGAYDAWTVHQADFLVSALEYGNSGEPLVGPPATTEAGRKGGIEECELATLAATVEARCAPLCAILAN